MSLAANKLCWRVVFPSGLALVVLSVVVAVIVKHLPSTKVYFSPDGGAEEAVISALNGAKDHIYLAMFYMSNPRIVDALVAAKTRGVRIFAVFDESQRQSFRYLQHGVNLRFHGIPVRYGSGVEGKMHSKCAVVDGRQVLTGSYNWTESAEHNNTEDLVLLTSRSAAREYEERFLRIWDESQNP